MISRRVTRSGVVWAVVALVLALLLAAPSPSVAQSPYASVVAYEVAEHLKFKGGAGTPLDFRVRFAKSTLLGYVVQSSGGAESPFVVGDYYDADAKSFVNARKSPR